MLLTSVKLVDVGVYKGSNIFSFKVEQDKPIVLYGGTNGAGKTTLFESIPLCLYGQNFGDKKITKKQYHEKIHGLFHRYTDTRTSAQDASVILEFQYAQRGSINQYQIVRRWQNNGGRIDEFLSMSKKSKTDKNYILINMNESQIQDTINQMIPKNIASLFFFDGEKIQKLAQTSNENIHIKSSFDSLLGLDIPSQLYDDMGLYLLRNSDAEADAVLAELEQKTGEKEKVEEKIGQLKEKYIFLQSEINSRHRELGLKEEKFFKMGGRFAQQRQKLVNEKIELEKDLSFIENNLNRIVEKNLPLDIVPEQLEQVREELKSDIIKTKESFQKDILSAAFNDLMESLKSFLKSYETKAKSDIIDKLQRTMDTKIESLSDRRKLTFDFSLSEMDVMLAKIDSVLNDANPIKIYYDAHMAYKEKLKDVNVNLDVAPKQDEVGPLYSEIKAVTLEIGEMEQELQTLGILEAQEKSLLVLLNSKIKKCLDKRKLDQRNMRGLGMAPKIQDVLDDYSQRLRTRKIQLLESNILKGIQKCFHKDRLITRISIDPEMYNVTLYRDNGDEITKEQLSKGELQMYATSIIWGLAKTSGCSLPFIIDTPLARLDAKHRENLIENFYPTAAHQTIIFSTNTEIVQSHYKALEPYISHTYLIEYDANKDGSLVNKGYFSGGHKITIR